MSDPRVTLPSEFASCDGKPMQIADPVVDLLRAPDGHRDRQLLYGEAVTQVTAQNGSSLIQADKDGYVGYVPTNALIPPTKPTFWVSTLATHIYQSANLKSRDLKTLSFGSLVTIDEIDAKFARCADGYIPAGHLTKIGTHLNDPVSVAELFIGTPYLWGGNSRLGIDCSGLVQAALTACNLPCPGDTDQQEAAIGTSLPPGSSYQRGDLLYWKGHVAMVVDANTLIHATGAPMAVVFEPITAAIKRIKDQDGHDVSSHKRL